MTDAERKDIENWAKEYERYRRTKNTFTKPEAPKDLSTSEDNAIVGK